MGFFGVLFIWPRTISKFVTERGFLSDLLTQPLKATTEIKASKISNDTALFWNIIFFPHLIYSLIYLKKSA